MPAGQGIHKRLSFRAIVCTASLAALAACSSRGDVEHRSQEEKLAWVETADPAKLAADDAAKGNLRFLSVCGFACLVPSLDPSSARNCYPRVKIEIVEGASDVIVSERHRLLNQQAWKLAEQYNAIVAAGERRDGHEACAAR